ncbi:MAG: GYD domain-containing protein [Chloroflexi bacterium]|nr:GYD domain-containing protein [Chloroflexota bacterium]
MATYLVLGNFTEQGMRAVKDSPKRAAAAREAFRVAGGNLRELYLSLGEYDFVAVSEFPDDETYTRTVLALAALGNVRPTTLKAFTEDEFRRIIGGLP